MAGLMKFDHHALLRPEFNGMATFRPMEMVWVMQGEETDGSAPGWSVAEKKEQTALTLTSRVRMDTSKSRADDASLVAGSFEIQSI